MDRRPELSEKLAQLTDGEQEFVWTDGRCLTLCRVEEISLDPPGRLAIIVHQGRFGLAEVVDKDGLRAFFIEWLGGGPITPRAYIRLHQIRALVK